MPRMSQHRLSEEHDAAQASNLCNTCAKCFTMCGYLNSRATRRISFYQPSAGYLVTVKCEGYLFWPERSTLVAPPNHQFIFGDELIST